MLFKNTIITLIILTTLCIGCKKNDDNDSTESNSASGVIKLSGEETSTFGTSLTVDKIIAEDASKTGTDKSVILFSKDIPLELINDDSDDINIENGFIIVAADFTEGGSTVANKAISMNILKDKQEHLYACVSPDLGEFSYCGDNFRIDFENKKVIFSNTTVYNTDNDAVLTMNGTISWK